MVFDMNNYLDFWNIIAFEIVGGTTLLMILAVIFISFFCAKYAVPFQTSILMLILFIAIFSILTANSGLWALVVFVVGAMFYWVLARMMRRN